LSSALNPETRTSNLETRNPKTFEKPEIDCSELEGELALDVRVHHNFGEVIEFNVTVTVAICLFKHLWHARQL
jgi:hypothetical protein